MGGLAGIARELGFHALPQPLDHTARAALGLPPTAHAAHVARGAGALRALLLELPAQGDSRAILTAVAAGLARQTAQLLWIVVATDGEFVSIICWSVGRAGPRVASLVCKRERLFTSDAETLCSLAAALNESDLLTYARWLDILGRESITRRFFRTLDETISLLANSIGGHIDARERRELALIYMSRLIFLSFLETKGWLDGDFGFLASSAHSILRSGRAPSGQSGSDEFPSSMVGCSRAPLSRKGRDAFHSATRLLVLRLALYYRATVSAGARTPSPGPTPR